MVVVDYDRTFLKFLRNYLKSNFTDVTTSYRARYDSNYPPYDTKYKGIVLQAYNNLGRFRFDFWGGTETVSLQIEFYNDGKKGTKNLVTTFTKGSGVFNGLSNTEVDFINSLLDKTSTMGNNALDFLMNKI